MRPDKERLDAQMAEEETVVADTAGISTVHVRACAMVPIAIAR